MLPRPGHCLVDHPERSNTDVARQLGVSSEIVRHWRERCRRLGPDALLDAPRPGAPCTVLDAEVERTVQLTLETL